jgi:hypothetical protein
VRISPETAHLYYPIAMVYSRVWPEASERRVEAESQKVGKYDYIEMAYLKPG